MRTFRTLALGAALLALLLGACTSGGSSASPSQPAGTAAESMAELPSITIGSAGFDESILIGEIYAQALEAAGYPVTRNLDTGTREVTLPALEGGQLDLMPEYIGSLLRGGLGGTPSGDPEVTFADLQTALVDVGLTALDYAPAQDQNAFVVRQETADQYNLQTMSDLGPIATQLVWGLPPECETNALCAGALEDAYGIAYADLNIEPLDACSAAIAIALNEGVVDVAELCSSQAEIAQLNFVVLTDDAQTQPSENIAPVVRTEWLDAAPASFAEALNAVSAALTTDELTALNVEVAVQNRDVAEVAAEWLTDSGLI